MFNIERMEQHEFTYGNKQLTMLKFTNEEWVPLLSDKFDPTTDKRIYQYLGRANSPNNVRCLIDDSSVDFLLINAGGGSIDKHDAIIDCPKNILLPFTQYYSRIDRDKVIFDVQTNGYSGADLVSHIYFEAGQMHMLFNHFELTNTDTTMSYNHGERMLTITLQWEQKNKFQIFIHGYDLTQLSFRLFNKRKHMIVPRIPAEGDDSDAAAPIYYEVFAMCSQESYQNLIANIDDECIAETVRFYAELPLLITIQFNDSRRHDSLIIGSPHSDIIQFTDNIKFGQGRNGNDVYSVNADNDNAVHEVVILNYADDNVLDFVSMQTEISRTFTRRNNSLVVGRVEVRDFFISSEYQHIAFADSESRQYFPLTSTFEMTPFISPTVQQNAFFFDATFNHSNIVLHGGNGDANYEMYRDNDDLLILQQRADNVSCIITIANFYIDGELWSNVTWIMYYDNGTLVHRYGFIFDRMNYIIDYKTKLRQDYDAMFIDFKFRPGISVALLDKQDNDRILVMQMDQRISAQRIDINQRRPNSPDNVHVIFIDNQFDQQFRVANWDYKPNRISIIELAMTVEHFEPVMVRGFNRFDANQTAEMQSMLHLAGDTYDLLPTITPLTMVGVKCIISNASLSGGEVNSFKCLGFKSLDEQVQFVNKYCAPDTYKWFKGNTTMEQIRTTIKFLRNQLTLQHAFENSDDNNCEPFFLSVFASDFVVDPSKLDLFTAINDTNKFKELIEKGADPRIQTNDTFHRTVLHMAAVGGNFELITFIVSRQLVDINAYDSEDVSALNIIFNDLNSRCGTDVVDKNCFSSVEVTNLLKIAEYLLSQSATVKTPLKVANIVNLICTYVCQLYPNIQTFADNLM